MGITAEQYQQLQKRLSGARHTAAPVHESSYNPAQANHHQVILGVDPSLRGTGFGVIQLARPYPKTLVQGTIKCSATWERSRCLVKTGQTLRDVIKEFRPSVCVIEGLFFAQNLQTALIMGEARGAILMTLAEAGLEIYEIAPRKMKQAIVGYGAAQKFAVGKMVQRMLHLAEPPAPDAADALALALTFAQENGRIALSAPKKI